MQFTIDMHVEQPINGVDPQCVNFSGLDRQSLHRVLRVSNLAADTAIQCVPFGYFRQAMGVYPTGTWVELLDGTVGVVCAQDERWPLTPQVAVVADNDGNPVGPHLTLASRLNPIVSARHDSNPNLVMPNLDAIA